MRIGINISLLCFDKPTGVGVYASSIIESLTRQYPEDTFELVALIPRGAATNILALDWINRSNCHVHVQKIPARVFSTTIDRWYGLSLPVEIYTRRSVDVFHHFDWHVLKSIAPMTSTVYDMTPLIEPQWHRHEQVIAYRQWWQRILHSSDFFFPISHYTQGQMERLFPTLKNKSDVIYPASRFVADPNTEYPHPQPKRKYFLSVGTIEPRKNYLLLLSAFKEFRMKHPGYELWIVGHSGWDTETLQIIKSTAGVRYFEYLNTTMLPSLYQHAIATIYPTLAEGFGLPVVEALSCGGIVISSNQTSIPEVGGDVIFYADPYQSYSWVSMMEKMINLDPTVRKRLVKKGLVRSHHFSYDQSAQLLHHRWQTIVTRRQGAHRSF